MACNHFSFIPSSFSCKEPVINPLEEMIVDAYSESSGLDYKVFAEDCSIISEAPPAGVIVTQLIFKVSFIIYKPMFYEEIPKYMSIKPLSFKRWLEGNDIHRHEGIYITLDGSFLSAERLVKSDYYRLDEDFLKQLYDYFVFTVEMRNESNKIKHNKSFTKCNEGYLALNNTMPCRVSFDCIEAELGSWLVFYCDHKKMNGQVLLDYNRN